MQEADCGFSGVLAVAISVFLEKSPVFKVGFIGEVPSTLISPLRIGFNHIFDDSSLKDVSWFSNQNTNYPNT